MARKIFINYRRGEALKDAQLLRTLLSGTFGSSRIFIDIHGIDGGENYVHVLAQQVAASDVMIALIGKNWVDLKDAEGNRRLDNPSDFVRFEIAQALQRDIPVLPVLLDGAPMPRMTQLPQDMMAMALFQAMPLRAESVDQDAASISRRLSIMLEKQQSHGIPFRTAGVGVVALLAIALLAGPFVLTQLGAPLLGVSLSNVATERLKKAEEDLASKSAALSNEQAKVADLQKQADSAGNQLATARTDLASTSAELSSAHARVADLQKQADSAGNQLTKARNDLASKSAELSSAQAKVADLQKQIGDAGDQLTKARVERDQTGSALRAMKAERDRLQQQLEQAQRGLLERRDQARAVLPGSGQSFRDTFQNGQPCSLCPEMVVVPAGNFVLGSPADEAERSVDEGPQINIVISRPFAVGKYSVTFMEWDACVQDGGCTNYRPNDRGWGREKNPVINVSWRDAKTFVEWLSRKTGWTYRLPAEAEREYVARAGTVTPFWWGRSISPTQANYNATHRYEGGGTTGQYRKRTLPVGSFQPNPWGLFDVHGNVWEWTEDCWSFDYRLQATNGSPRTGPADCSRVIRGGSWDDRPKTLRSAYRKYQLPLYRTDELGFRVARDVDP